MKITLIVLATVVALVLVIVAIGYALPQNHVASRERNYRAPPEAVFAAITTPAAYPEWRSGVKKVDMLPPMQGKTTFRESSSDGDITFVFDEAVPGKRVVSRIADKELPFGGSWTYDLNPTAEGTRLRITENGEVYNPIFRFMSRFVFGHTASIDKYMDDLERRLAAASR